MPRFRDIISCIALGAVAYQRDPDYDGDHGDCTSLIQSAELGKQGLVPKKHPITHDQFLIISSPLQKKIVYTTLEMMQSKEGRTLALVDDGLARPEGIAFDHYNGTLYVADPGTKSIYGYSILIKTGGTEKTLFAGPRVPIITGHEVEWLAVDGHGHLFFTTKGLNSINKISSHVLWRLRSGKFHPNSLHLLSEQAVESRQLAERAKKTSTNASTNASANATKLVTNVPSTQPEIESIYQGGISPLVSNPGAIEVDGDDLYWTNQINGKTAGDVVKGETHPQLPTNASSTSHFPASALTSISSGAFDLAKAGGHMFFTRNGTIPGTGLVTGFLLSDPAILVDFASSIPQPRGLAFDNDSTMYVADHENGKVWSFPTGRVMANAPMELAVRMAGAYGLTIMRSSDPCFKESLIQEEPNHLHAAKSFRGKRAARGVSRR